MDMFILLWRGLIILFGGAAAYFDIKSKRIPNGLILIMMISWVIMLTPKMFLNTGTAIGILKDSLIGFLIGGGMFLFVYIVSHKGLGGGDVKFMAASGLYTGFSGTISVMFYGTVIAAFFGIVLLILKKIRRRDSIPLAPFLCAGILITVFFA